MVIAANIIGFILLWVFHIIITNVINIPLTRITEGKLPLVVGITTSLIGSISSILLTVFLLSKFDHILSFITILVWGLLMLSSYTLSSDKLRLESLPSSETDPSPEDKKELTSFSNILIYTQKGQLLGTMLGVSAYLADIFFLS